jgi:prepilin-type N-terminal cleavage/methylation domain-containing protein
VDARSAGTGGFTLVEILIVMSILVILCGMLTPFVALAKRSSLRTVSQSIMGKTEAALHQYKADFSGYPYQLSYADEDETSADTNTLCYNVGTDIVPADAANVRADMAAAEALYGYDTALSSPCASRQAFTANRRNGLSSQDASNDPEGDPYPSGTYLDSQTGQYFWVYDGGSFPATCVLLNRLGSQRAAELMLIGDVHASGVNMPPCTGPGGLTHSGRNMAGPANQLLNAPRSFDRPGWAKDYLQGQIATRYLRGGAILDAYLNPLIYICQVESGVENTYGMIQGYGVDVHNPADYGLQPHGRRTLEPFNPGTSTQITGDAYLPDINNLFHSDRRYWATPGFELEFELWSAGPDGQFGWWRDDQSNQDNIPCERYDDGIGSMP